MSLKKSEKKAIKVVIDTNVFVSSFFGGLPRKIIDLWKTGEVILCLSQPIIEEYITVLLRLIPEGKSEIGKLARLFAEGYNSEFTAKTPKINVVKEDKSDNKFIECAVALDCEFIVSGDKHLKQIKKYVNIKIFSPRDFLSEIKRMK